jgi:WXG100 family type VII secretion target
MPQVKVTFETIAQAEQSISATVAAVNAKTEDLQRFVANLVANWSGDAQEHYHQVQTQWDNANKDLQAVLTAIAKAVGAAHEGYMATEKANTQMWNG